MKEVQAILREIVTHLDRVEAATRVLSAEIQRVAPRTGIEIQELMNQSYQQNRQVYEGLRKRIDELT